MHEQVQSPTNKDQESNILKLNQHILITTTTQDSQKKNKERKEMTRGSGAYSVGTRSGSHGVQESLEQRARSGVSKNDVMIRSCTCRYNL